MGCFFLLSHWEILSVLQNFRYLGIKLSQLFVTGFNWNNLHIHLNNKHESIQLYVFESDRGEISWVFLTVVFLSVSNFIVTGIPSNQQVHHLPSSF